MAVCVSFAQPPNRPTEYGAVGNYENTYELERSVNLILIELHEKIIKGRNEMLKETVTTEYGISGNSTVKVSFQGNTIDTMYQSKRNITCYVKKLNADEYVDERTGEVKQFKHGTSRASDLNNVRVSLKKLRELINTNVIDNTHCAWVTLTYAENMQDVKRLYKDFEKFIKRLKYNIKQGFEYIVAMEPQGRGAWHCHMILIFNEKAPYIANKTMADIWGQGFVTVKGLKDMDNLGAYLTAYLGDMELVGEPQDGNAIKTVTVEENGKKVSKAVVKGGRLPLYPKGFNIYRFSKGIKKPIERMIRESELKEIVKGFKLTFKKTIRLFDDVIKFEKYILYRQYKKIGGTFIKCTT